MASLTNNLNRQSEVFRGVPTFFRASCWEATQGGAHSYIGAGWNLASHASRLLEPQDEPDAVAAKLDRLAKLLDPVHGTGFDVLCWFDREFPRCMGLVSRKGRRSFLKGVRRAAEEERIFD